jgi:uncharacterized protein (TIGR02391 family)
VNIDWMRQKLTTFLDLCEEHDDRDRASGHKYDRPIMKPINDKIADALPTVEQIIRQLDPRLLTNGFGRADAMVGTMSESSEQTRKALAVLRDQEEWKINLAPDSPSLTADRLHPMIWGAAATIWETGEYRLAAESACGSLSAHIKARTGSPLNDRKLVAQVFSADEPRAGQSRLHFPGDPADETWQSRQQGLHLVAQGAFAGIRNIAAHGTTSWTEHEALEHLAVLSVVARWADETQLMSG